MSKNRKDEDFSYRYWNRSVHNFESGKIISAICHGVCRLLNMRLSDDNYILIGRTIPGFSWFEEILARRNGDEPFNIESALKERGSYYKKALLPMASKV